MSQDKGGRPVRLRESANATTFTISDLAKEFDITTRAIRYYEDQGLITPARRGSRRIYTRRDRVRLGLILRGKAEIDELEQTVAITRAAPKGLLKVNATLGFGRSYIAPAISRFAREYPDLEVQIAADGSAAEPRGGSHRRGHPVWRTARLPGRGAQDRQQPAAHLRRAHLPESTWPAAGAQ